MSADLHRFTSGYSGSQGGDRAEVATCPRTVHVRASRAPAVPARSLSPGAWPSFLGHAAGSAA
ncbi:DUF397 domain-containing protein [Streptomyces sp. NBC_00654]|uniref:DUF397 domain-containing protein n=1 Tax=Streptomyces sp. NBC_00654 TaxID=2975799 RepID=UPI00225B7E0C|nr:DUF397 domain-containing protein [Streptomyces sp. NBC_00654]MCX4970148.1 DUF397 domain-containing protein [Streptomyces sp. NBC_00654]